MTWQIFWDLVVRIGLPGAAGFGAAWLLYAGKIRPKRDVDEAKQDAEQLRLDYERRLAEMRSDCDLRLAEALKDRDYYRDKTMMLLENYDREVATSEAAVRTAVRVASRRP